ncbi:MAG: hypothetical protein QW597_01380 [Thermoplasmataceae archaeon]
MKKVKICSLCRSRSVKSLYVRESVTDLRLLALEDVKPTGQVSPLRYAQVMEGEISRQRFLPFGVVCLKCGHITVTNAAYMGKTKRIPVKSKARVSQAHLEDMKKRLESHWVR